MTQKELGQLQKLADSEEWKVLSAIIDDKINKSNEDIQPMDTLWGTAKVTIKNKSRIEALREILKIVNEAHKK